MDGFEGISIENTPTEAMDYQKGFKGVSFEYNQAQYFEHKEGFKSIGVEYDIGGSALKIWHFIP